MRSYLTLIIFITVISVIFPCSLRASTDPQYATASATATVPVKTATTSDTTPPSTPILISPLDGTQTSDNTPLFVWNQSSDPDGNSLTYTLYLNNVATYLGVSNTGNSIGPRYTAVLDTGQIKLTPTIALSDGLYDWYVVATDISGNSRRSTTWSLTIDTAPPFILITDIDTYHDLALDSRNGESVEEQSFTLHGPKNINITAISKPFATLTLQFFDADLALVSLSSWPLDSTGHAYPYTYLSLGTYTVQASVVDTVGLTAALPSFTLIVTQATITIPLPPLVGLPPSYVIPYTPPSLPSFPATIARITSRLNLSYIILTLLALAILVMIIFLWNRRFNLLILDTHTGKPYRSLIVYHSSPESSFTHSLVLVTKHEPISYELDFSDHGLLRIPRLGRYSTLTIRTASATHILSLSLHQKFYTLEL